MEASLDYRAIFCQNKPQPLPPSWAWWSTSIILAEAGGYKFIANLNYNRKPTDKMKESIKAGDAFSCCPIQASAGKVHTLRVRGQWCLSPKLCLPLQP